MSAPSGIHEIVDLRRAPGELSFEARVGAIAQRVWFRSQTEVLPGAEAALATCLMPAMYEGGTLEMSDPVSPRVLRTQRQFQAIQRAWSHGSESEFGQLLREVEVVAPVRPPEPPAAPRVAAFFSGGVDSWATILGNPDVTDLIFVRGFDLMPRLAHQGGLADEVEDRLRAAADSLGLPLHVVETNLRDLTDQIVPWEAYYGCAAVAVTLFLAPLFERVLIAGDSDYEVQLRTGANWMVDQLWSTEQLEIVDDGGLHSRMERLARIAEDPVVQRTLRVCWENPDAAYNCGRCRKCLMTMVGLETLGVRERMATFPAELDLDAVASIELTRPILLSLWEDLLDATRAAGRPDLERAVEAPVSRGKRLLGLPPSFRRRPTPGPPPTVRLAVVIPAWRQARYLAGAVGSALDQKIGIGVGVVIVNDGCPEPEAHSIGQAMRDAHPDRVSYLHQPNRGVSAARNAAIRQVFARWPHVEAVFPLDADNLLSQHTLAELWALLEDRPDAAWASPTLEFFGAEEGEWRIPGPYLPYRQLFANQCDTGSLIRREVFDAGIEYDESMRNGLEDWEMFLSATLAGFRGVPAGRCGFRYRRRSKSMLTGALARPEPVEAEIRGHHPDAYEPVALTRREHEEMPRFALVRCDRGDVLLTASAELEPRPLPLAVFARSLAAAGGPDPSIADYVPAITVLTGSATISSLEKAGKLAEALSGLQREMRGRAVVGLRTGAPDAGLAALAVRGSGLGGLAGGAEPATDALVELDLGRAAAGDPLPWSALSTPAALIGTAMIGEGMPLPEASHSSFFEHRHIEETRARA